MSPEINQNDKLYFANTATIKELFRQADVPFIPGLKKYYYAGIYIHVSPLVKTGEFIQIDSGEDSWDYLNHSPN